VRRSGKNQRLWVIFRVQGWTYRFSTVSAFRPTKVGLID